MALIYRALWRDDRAELIDRVHEAFTVWVCGRYHVLGEVAEGRTDIELGDLRLAVESRRACLELGHSSGGGLGDGVEPGSDRGLDRGLDDTLVEDRASERRRTRLRALVDGVTGEQWVWVDVDRVSSGPSIPYAIPHGIPPGVPPAVPSGIAAPSLVCRLLDEAAAAGGRPRLGGVELGTTAREVSPTSVDELAGLIADPEREIPLVVFACGGPSLGVNVTAADVRRRADDAAEILAGVAAVYTVGPEAEAALAEGPGRDLVAGSGAVRLYPPVSGERGSRAPWPGPWPGTPACPLDARMPPRQVTRIHARLRSRLRQVRLGSSAELVAATEAELARTRAEVTQMRQSLTDLRGELRTTEDDYLQALGDLEAAQDELRAERRRVRELSDRLAGATTGAPGWAVPETASTVSEAVELARRHLERIVIADGACRGLEDLDTAIEARAWGDSAWRALRALDAYAHAATGFNGGFWEWCQNTDAVDRWPATTKKLAMRESQTVMTNERLKEYRRLPVDRRVDPSGRILMEAHLKIAEGGGMNAPRIYFHDDTGGATGKVHVGFVGPHKYMPNTRA